MNRQYIGARYVPKFSDINGGVWNNTYSYEPLEIVKHGNDFYTSKKPVPTGIAITNTEYWVLTGNYNGAIQQINDEITVINGEIDNLNAGYDKRFTLLNRKFIFISDSYGAMTDMFNNVVANLNLTAGNYTIEVESGDSFVGSEITGRFISRMVDGIAKFSDPNKITDIVVVGGLNDSPNAYTGGEALYNAMSEFNTYAKNHCPNAQIHLGYVGYVDISHPNAVNNEFSKQFITLQRYIDNANEFGWHYMTNIEYTLKGWDSLLSDGVHPNTEGALKLGKTIVQGLLTGSCDVAYRGADVTSFTTGTLPSGIDSITGIGIGMYSITNNVTSFTTTPMEINFNYQNDVAFHSLSWDIPITDYPFKLIDNTRPIVINVIGMLNYNENGASKYMLCPVFISFMMDKIRIKAMPFINGTNNFVTAKPVWLHIDNPQNVCINTIRI